MQGLFLLNKPSGPSSAQFLGQLKRVLHIPRNIRVGHGGTLDPFAQGLLVVGISRAYTKLLHNYLKEEKKEYEAEIILGAFSDTNDRTGIIQTPDTTIFFQQLISLPAQKGAIGLKNSIRSAIEELQKNTQQIPPQYSAIKIKGKPAYQRVRKGEVVDIEPKKAFLYNYKLLEVSLKEGLILVRMLLSVSAGFYIRSFARDLGDRLGIGGYVYALKRLKIGDFSLKNALNLDDFNKIITLYVQLKNKQKIGDFIDFSQKLSRNLGVSFNTLHNNVYIFSGPFGMVQKTLIEIKKYAAVNDIDENDWFGKEIVS